MRSIRPTTVNDLIAVAAMEMADAARTIELRRLVVHPGSRGMGQGRALLKAALTRAYDHQRAHRV